MRAAQAFLDELRELGIVVRVVGGRLRYRPVEAVTPEIRERMVRLKPELIALLVAAEPEEVPIPEYGDGDQPSVDRCPKCGEADFMRPRPRGRWCCARCHPYEGLAAPDVERWPRVQVPFLPLEVLLRLESADGVPTRPCWSCGGVDFWRLRAGGDGICRRCHPPQPSPGAIEAVAVQEVQR